MRTKFEEKLLPLLTYVGSIGAALMCVGYIITVFVLIFGFKANDILQTTVFGIVNAIVGFLIMQLLKLQGQDLAKDDPENKKVIDEYYNNKTKDKKFHSMTYYWITSVVKDLFVKCSLLAVTSIGVIYIVIQGSRDYTLIALAAVNLLMFICFGLLSLVKAYEYYNNMHIPYLKEQIKLSKREKETL